MDELLELDDELLLEEELDEELEDELELEEELELDEELLSMPPQPDSAAARIKIDQPCLIVLGVNIIGDSK